MSEIRHNNVMKRTEYSGNKSSKLEATLFANSTNQNTLCNKQSSFVSSTKYANNLFKVANLENVSGKKTTNRSMLSPTSRVHTQRKNNDVKVIQQPKMSFLSRSSFVNPRKTLLCSRTKTLNARKEVIKKMVLLAENVPEKMTFKLSTPVKLPAGLTPRKTPRPKNYLTLPEFKKMGVVDLGTPIQDVVADAPTPFLSKKNNITVLDTIVDGKLNLSKEDINLKCCVSNNSAIFRKMLQQCRTYNTEVGLIYAKLRILDECFESNIKELSDFEFFEKFCQYQCEKEEIYEELKALEKKLEISMQLQMQVGQKLKDYLEKRHKLFEKRTKLHKNFEEVVKFAEKKCEEGERLGKNAVEELEKKEGMEMADQKQETPPKYRRSLRLSKIQKKSKYEEKTPITKKLKKLDCKSKRIKGGRN